MSITTKKVLFWMVWIIAVPVVFLGCCFTSIVEAFRVRRLPYCPMLIFKIILVKQAVYEQMVLQKKEVMEDVFSRAENNPSPRFKSEREHIVKQAKIQL